MDHAKNCSRVNSLCLKGESPSDLTGGTVEMPRTSPKFSSTVNNRWLLDRCPLCISMFSSNTRGLRLYSDLISYNAIWSTQHHPWSSVIRKDWSESNLAFRSNFQFAGKTEDKGICLIPQGSNQTNPGWTSYGTAAPGAEDRRVVLGCTGGGGDCSTLRETKKAPNQA